MQVSGVYLSDAVHWSDVVCEYDVQQHMLRKIQSSAVAVERHLMSPAAEYMVFELQPPADVFGLEQRAVHLSSCISSALVCAPCVILRVSLQPFTSADLHAMCAAEVPSHWVQRRYHLQLQSVASSVQWMAQPKQPKEWGDKKGSTRKMSTTSKKRCVRAAEVLEEDDDVEEVVEDVDEQDCDENSDDVDDVDGGECEGEEDDEAEAEDAGGDELELEDDEEEEDEEEGDDAVSGNSSQEDVNEAEDARGKQDVKKARRS